ncbi:MAG: hypothetical protein R3A48_03775 [Polyangiales bacterium]
MKLAKPRMVGRRPKRSPKDPPRDAPTRLPAPKSESTIPACASV